MTMVPDSYKHRYCWWSLLLLLLLLWLVTVGCDWLVGWLLFFLSVVMVILMLSSSPLSQLLLDPILPHVIVTAPALPLPQQTVQTPSASRRPGTPLVADQAERLLGRLLLHTTRKREKRDAEMMMI